MAEIIQTGQRHAGSIRAQDVTLVIGGQPAAGLGLQNMTIEFRMAAPRFLFEIGSANVYFAGGRGQGVANIGQIVGPAGLAPQILRTFGDLCNPADLELRLGGVNCTRGVGGVQENVLLKSAFMTGVGYQTSADDVLITRQVSLMFVALHN